MATAGVVVPLADVVRYAQNRAEVSLLLDIGLLGRLFESAAASAREWHRRATVGALAEACEANERYQLSVRVGLWAGPRPGQILRGVCSGACRDQLPAVAALLGPAIEAADRAFATATAHAGALGALLSTCVDRCQQFERANRAFARELVRRRSAPEVALDKLVLADVEQTLASRVIQMLHAASDGHRSTADQLPSWADVIAQSHQRWAESTGAGAGAGADRKRPRTSDPAQAPPERSNDVEEPPKRTRSAPADEGGAVVPSARPTHTDREADGGGGADAATPADNVPTAASAVPAAGAAGISPSAQALAGSLDGLLWSVGPVTARKAPPPLPPEGLEISPGRPPPDGAAGDLGWSPLPARAAAAPPPAQSK